MRTTAACDYDNPWFTSRQIKQELQLELCKEVFMESLALAHVPFCGIPSPRHSGSS